MLKNKDIKNNSNKLTNKHYPPELEKAVLKSLSFYPLLNGIEIHFRYAENIKHSIMQAQPLFKSFFKPPHKRVYVIRMRRNFQIEGEQQEIRQLPFNVLVGWLGHELGHVMDYLHRSATSMLGFGIGYVFSPNFVKGAERTADEFAVSHGMGPYIEETKNFILNHADFPETYKNKIRTLYLSPDEIMEMVQEHEIPEALR